MRRNLLLAGFLLITLAAQCAPIPQHTPTPPSPTATHLPTALPSNTPPPEPTSTAEPVLSIHILSYLFDPESGVSAVIGFMQNESDHTLTGVILRIRLEDQDGNLLAQETLSSPFVYIDQDEVIPFTVDFFDVGETAQVHSEVVQVQESDSHRIPLEVEIIGSTVLNDGTYGILGWIRNPGSSYVSVHQILLLLENESGESMELSKASVATTSLMPGQSSPFIVKFQCQPDLSLIETFVDATSTSEFTQPPFTLSQPLKIILDPQGRIHVLGAVQNEGSQSHWLTATLILEQDGELISIAPLIYPSPLVPSESLAFGISDFPGWSSRLSTIGGSQEDLTVDILFDSQGSQETTISSVPLDAEITGVETTGSAIILRGSVHNPGNEVLFHPVAYAVILSIDGSSRAAGWITIQENLLPGQSTTFVLPVRIPTELDITSMEYVFRATALTEDPGTSH